MMEDGFSSYSSLYDTSSLLQFCNGKESKVGSLSPPPLCIGAAVEGWGGGERERRPSTVTAEGG